MVKKVRKYANGGFAEGLTSGYSKAVALRKKKEEKKSDDDDDDDVPYGAVSVPSKGIGGTVANRIKKMGAPQSFKNGGRVKARKR